MTKTEVYKMAIDFHKKHGQGLSGIVKLGNDPTVSEHLKTLVDEGFLEIYNDGNSMGHPYTSQHYFPKEGYNVYKDAIDNGLDDIGYLNEIRFYLDCLDEDDDDRTELQKWINPSRNMLAKNVPLTHLSAFCQRFSSFGLFFLSSRINSSNFKILISFSYFLIFYFFIF